jgi:hypothetical protein
MVLVRTLVSMGVLPAKRTGPATARSPSEARRVRLAQMSDGDKRRRLLIREAKEQGLPPPVFRRGRPCKYNTEEDRTIARKEQYERGRILYNRRLQEGLEAIRAPNELLAQWST